MPNKPDQPDQRLPKVTIIVEWQGMVQTIVMRAEGTSQSFDQPTGFDSIIGKTTSMSFRGQIVEAMQRPSDDAALRIRPPPR